MRLGLTVFIIIGLIFLAFGCGKDDSPTGGGADLTYTYDDYVHFDTTQYLLSSWTGWGSTPTGREPVMSWEVSLGEPFHDVNGNGIYEPEIDSFVMALDPDINQDLDRNGQYTSPSDVWQPGVPFDDINGDGTLVAYPGDPNVDLLPGMPYCDINQNGIRDTDLHNMHSITKWFCDHRDTTSDRRVYFCSPQRYWYEFVSDSGIYYRMEFHGGAGVSGAFYESDSGLYVALGLNGYSVSPEFPLLEKGVIEEETNEEFVPQYLYNYGRFYRSIEFNASLVIEGNQFNDLLLVRYIANSHIYMGSNYIFEWYFDRQLGLIAVGGGSEISINTEIPNDLIPSSYSFCYWPITVGDSLLFEMSR